MLLSLNNFIHILFHSILNVVNPPTPESMLFVVKERLVGLKHNTGFGGRGWGYTRVGDCYVHCPKRGHFIEVSQHFCPSLQFWIYFENKKSGTHPVIHIKAIIACHTLKSHYCQTVEELLSYWYYRRNIIFYFLVLLTIQATRPQGCCPRCCSRHYKSNMTNIVKLV